MLKNLLIVFLLIFIWANTAFAIPFTATKLEEASGAPKLTTNNLALGDFNNDGYLDIFAPNGGTSDESNLIFVNDGSGSFTSYISMENVSSKKANSQACALADFDNDGDLDAVVANKNTDKANVLYWNNNMSFTPQELPGTINEALGIAAGDLDLDGDYDIVAVNNGAAHQIYWNNGDGTFADSTFGSSGNAQDVVLRDLNNDGLLDAAIVNYGGNLQVYFNNGSGFNNTADWSSLNSYNATGLDLIDINENGYLDIVVSGDKSVEDDKNVYIFENAGDETFSLIESKNCVYITTNDIQGVDLDADGDIDLVTGHSGDLGSEDGRDKYYLNNGFGSFGSCVSIDGTNGQGYTMGIAVGDIDNDGYIDVITGNYYINLTDYKYNYIFKNTSDATNQVPSPPTNLSFVENGNLWTLQWDAGSDDVADTTVLTYNLRLGTTSGGNEVISSVIGTGPGNMGHRYSITIDVNEIGLDPSDNYFWSVQTVDNAWYRSSWSAEQEINANTPPTIDPPLTNKIFDEGATSGSYINLKATDPDDNTVFSWESTIIPDTTGLTVSISPYSTYYRAYIDPTGASYGVEQVVFTVYDGNGGSDSDTITVTINDLPEISPPIPDVYIIEDSISDTLDLDNYVIDHDNAKSSLIWMHSTTTYLNVSINSDHVVTFTPSANFNGTRNITFSVKDYRNVWDSQSITVHIQAVNDPPTLDDSVSPFAFDEDTQAIMYLASYLGLSDPDLSYEGDTHTWTVTGNDNLDININNQNGTATISSSQEHWFGEDMVTFTVTDSGNESDNVSVTIQVTKVNDPPVVSDIPPIQIDEEGADTLYLNQYVTDPDFSAPGDVITWSCPNSDPATVGVTFIEDSIAIIQGGQDWNGTKQLTFVAEDLDGATDSAIVSVTVNPVNDPPVLSFPSGLSITFEEDSQDTFDLNPYVTDPDTGDVFLWSGTGTSNIFVNLDSNTGIAIISASANWFGEDYIYFSVQDTAQATSSDSIFVHVTPVNDPPVMASIADTLKAYEESLFVYTFYATDLDPSDILTFYDNTTLFNINTFTGKVSFTPEREEVGVHTFQVWVNDGNGGSDTLNVILEVIETYKIWDIDKDKKYVDEDDLMMFIELMQGEYNSDYDVNDDGKLDILDLQELITHWKEEGY